MGEEYKHSHGLSMPYLFRLGYRFKPTYENHKLTMAVQAA